MSGDHSENIRQTSSECPQPSSLPESAWKIVDKKTKKAIDASAKAGWTLYK